jgi:glycosyltransferase involved in cell wall biosynthesis
VKVTHVHRIGGIGGSERHLLTLLPALAKRGADVSFIGLDNPAGAPDPFYDELEAHGVPFERLRSAHDLDPVLAVRLPRAVHARHPDILHTHLVHADVYGALAPGVRLVSTKHNPDPFRLGPFRRVERALARRTRRIIAISEAVRRFSIDEVGLPAEKFELVYYGLDELPRPWGSNPPLPVPEGAPLLLCVARLTMQKGIDIAIRALPRVPAATLLVLGDGTGRAALRRLANELGVGDRLVMPGRVGDVASIYRRADVVVHPVRWEGFGLAMLEAMLAEKPVVATRAGAAPELVVDGQTGVIVPASDSPALAAAVSSLISDPARSAALGRAGLARARAEFSVELMTDRTIEVYERVVAIASR